MSPEDAERELMRAADQAFLDDKIPALDGRTPREAARDPALRPKLIQLMKERVRSHDERNLQTGRADDINWLLRELKLDEIIFDPPPWRPPPPKPDDDDDDFSELPDFDGSAGVDPNRPPAPRLPEAPLGFEEAVARLQTAMDLFDTAAEAEEELVASGATILEDADELTRTAWQKMIFASPSRFCCKPGLPWCRAAAARRKLILPTLKNLSRPICASLRFAPKRELPKNWNLFFRAARSPD